MRDELAGHEATERGRGRSGSIYPSQVCVHQRTPNSKCRQLQKSRKPQQAVSTRARGWVPCCRCQSTRPCIVKNREPFKRQSLTKGCNCRQTSCRKRAFPRNTGEGLDRNGERSGSVAFEPYSFCHLIDAPLLRQPFVHTCSRMRAFWLSSLARSVCLSRCLDLLSTCLLILSLRLSVICSLFLLLSSIPSCFRLQVNLDTLDLSRNKIDSFEGLEHLGQLTDLWVRRRQMIDHHATEIHLKIVRWSLNAQRKSVRIVTGEPFP